MPEIDLKAQFGPLPVWGWGVIVGMLGLLAYFVWSRRGGASNLDGTAPATAGANLDAMGYQTSGLDGPAGMDASPALPENNVGWLARVSRAVSDTLAASPSEVYAALQKYLSGQSLSTKERNYVDKAIQVGMSPPEGTQGISDVVTTAPSVYRVRMPGSGGLHGVAYTVGDGYVRESTLGVGDNVTWVSENELLNVLGGKVNRNQLADIIGGKTLNY